MRTIVYYIYLSLLLLCGGKHVFAANNPITTVCSFDHNFAEKQELKISNPAKSSLSIDQADIDLDEEFHTDSNSADGTAKLVATLSHSICFSSLHSFVAKDYSNRIKIFSSFCGYFNPIYIKQRVLRI
ncbi:hypothetical protein [Flavobacterium granuli]|uniref:Uncharacterized protein n=1 Tax=Flavobacterium granuli TaxID=280093 RepID=A0A1M5QJ85_9FLAO|nr:hypothetical protein [Flavobacterium granuli]PRZ20099.1 hypothetical protein BC624_11359 [Flavobacterium granuli]SHH13926.1 hypothetical protein SAMN05443373_10816 [Flavobacterium granuli]